MKPATLFRLILALFVLCLAAMPAAAAEKPLPADVIRILTEGNQRFASGHAGHPHTAIGRINLAGVENQGDHAIATVIACSDSRVPVERIFDTGVMDTFIIRVAGNVVDVDEAGSIEYGLAHVKTPLMVVLGHTQCGAVTAVTHAVHGTGHALEINIPPLVDNIIPAVNRAISLHPQVQGDAIIPHAIVENVWQGVEDLFMRSPTARNLVRSGKAKVVGAIYNVGTGQVEWLPEAPVSSILARVEANPAREMNAMAGGHGQTDTQGAGHGEAAGGHGTTAGHAEVQAVPVTLADAGTLDLLNTDWLNRQDAQTQAAAARVGFSSLFWTFLAGVGALVVMALVLFVGGTFKRFSLNMKLYTSYGSLILLAVLLGVGGYLYLSRVNAQAHLETAFLDMDMMAAEMMVTQNEFLLHGIENKAYGEKQVAVVRDLVKQFGEDAQALIAIGYLDGPQTASLEKINAGIGKYAGEFEAVVKDFHEIEAAKESMDEEFERVEHALEKMIHHHESELAGLESRGSDMRAISYQTTLVGHLNSAEALMLKAAHGEVEFLLDKQAARVGTLEKDLGRLKGYLKALEEELRSAEEKQSLQAIEHAVAAYMGSLKRVIRDEANIEKATAEIKELLHAVEADSTRLSREAEIAADGMKREATIAMMVLSLIALVSGTLLAVFVARGISRPINKTIEGLNNGAEQVASASSQVSSASQQLAEGASEQAASIEETSASLEEMSAMTQQNADHANQADSLMKEANQVVASANSSMTELTTSMSDISKASEETSKIIKTIDEIAFQTNLLALNAAVEAARAGEAGAGFAVVADEVRNLAMRAADAAKNTALLIEGTVKKVTDGTALVTRTNEAFIKVAESAGKVGDLVGEIAAASNEQASGIGQVNQAVTDMDKVTQQNAANAEESASASEEMNAQAEQMKGMVAELVQIVGGAARGAIAHTRASHKKGAGKTLHPQAKRTRALTTHRAATRPEEVIPLDDDGDFQDF